MDRKTALKIRLAYVHSTCDICMKVSGDLREYDFGKTSDGQRAVFRVCARCRRYSEWMDFAAETIYKTIGQSDGNSQADNVWDITVSDRAGERRFQIPGTTLKEILKGKGL